MEDLLRAVLRNYRAYVRHKLYLAASMTYMYVAMSITVPVLAADLATKLLSLTGVLAAASIAAAITVGAALAIYAMTSIWAVAAEQYAGLSGEGRPANVWRYFIIWASSFPAAYALSLALSAPSYMVEEAWLLGVGLGNVGMGLWRRLPIPALVGATCCAVYASLTMVPASLAPYAAMLCMLFTYTAASMAYLILSRRELERALKGSEHE